MCGCFLAGLAGAVLGSNRNNNRNDVAGERFEPEMTVYRNCCGGCVRCHREEKKCHSRCR